MDEFIALLNDQRQLLDDLLYRLVAARGVLAAGEIRFVGRASAEIETVINEIYVAESRRAEAIAQIALRLDISPKQITLRSLAQAAPSRIAACWSTCTASSSVSPTRSSGPSPPTSRSQPRARLSSAAC